MKSIIVLGAGMVGKAIAADLCKNFKVTSTDIDKTAFSFLRKNFGIATRTLDVGDTGQLRKAVKNFDLVVSAVPGFLGFRVLKTLIESGKNVVDISFFPENPLALNLLAKKKKVTAIVDAGVAPGMDNLILGYHNARMKVDFFECLVGGLPKKPTPPYYYKAPFSPIDVIEEYIRSARFVKNGKLVIKPPLTDKEIVHLPKAGKLTAFNTDGLRTLITTMKHIPNMIEKTLRYPEHLVIIEALRDGGFFGKKEIPINKNKFSPLAFTSKFLIDHWKLLPGEKEFTVMRVTVAGKEKDKRKKYIYHLYDEYDKKTGMSSMARTTGYTCTAAANLVLNGMFSKNGVFPMDLIGDDERCFRFVFDYLEKRGVRYRKR